MMTKLRGILQELVGDDTRAVALCNMDGQVIEAVTKSGDDLQGVAADLAAFLKVGAYCARKLEGGDLDHVTMTTDNMAVLAVTIGTGHYLATVLDAGGNVARARMVIRRRKTEITEELT
ncbi:MAG: roadblock/LC7 domain-containing protein [Armatimonadota bacterium]|nr:roadblock/LC7 domain-containing protein [Armatimonadota bacterium]